eukprot:COSAG06_NODE_5340_length_3538_cov_5.196569_2_plen_46_part_00
MCRNLIDQIPTHREGHMGAAIWGRPYGGGHIGGGHIGGGHMGAAI